MHRLLEVGDVIQDGDEYLFYGDVRHEWMLYDGSRQGCVYGGKSVWIGSTWRESMVPVRRKIQDNLEAVEEEKMTEKGIKFDSKKTCYHLIDPDFEESVAKVATFGLNKYGEFNWQSVDSAHKRYFNALRRHIKEWEKGNILDNETGFPHLAHAAWNCMALMWFDKKKSKKGIL